MQTRILDGRKIAAEMEAEVGREVRELAARGIEPSLAVVLVGEDPASRIYVGGKTRACQRLGIRSRTIQRPADTSQQELEDIIEQLNQDETVDGILLQLPLPAGIDAWALISSIRPEKDVDGFHPLNLGRLFAGRPGLTACTPTGILELLRREGIEMEGREAVVVGRSNIVGKPMALLLLREHATVTLCHSRTQDLEAVCRRADILVAAAGRKALIGRRYIKEGAVLIDVGINRVETLEEAVRLFGPDSPRLERLRQRGYTLVGDIHPREALGRASALTPVPGGVGPLTIAQLMKNTLQACTLRGRASDV